MDSFEQLVDQYTPMIHKIMHSLHIYRNKEELFQLALISLWEATHGFDPSKGNFTNYAYSYIKGKLLSDLSKRQREAERTISAKAEFLLAIEDPHHDVPLAVEQLLVYGEMLSPKERLWLKATFLDDLSPKELAEREQASPSAVKQWKHGALKKLRAQLFQS